MSEVSGTTVSKARPVVGIVMGSDSDWPVMGAAAEVLDEFGVAYEADVVSAHRMPTEMIDYGRAAAERGLRVIIAGAGGAAHLPGMLAGEEATRLAAAMRAFQKDLGEVAHAKGAALRERLRG